MAAGPRACLLVTLLSLCSCRARQELRPSAEEAVLEKQVQGLRALIAAAEKGPLIPFRQALVVLDQGLVQKLISAAIPFERVVSDRYRVRVTGVSVDFDDGFALLRLDGRASLASQPDSAAFAEVQLFGGLNTMELDPGSGALRAKVDLIAFDVRRVAVLGVDAPPQAEKLVEDLARQRVESFAVLASGVEVPVRVEREIEIPALEEKEVRIPAARVPLALSVQDVKALRGKLWVCVGAATAPPSASPTPAPPGAP